MATTGAAQQSTDTVRSLRVLLYSDDRSTRDHVRAALGTSLGAGLPALEFVDVATAAAAIRTMDAGGYDLLILDGEAVPTGGMGLCHQLKDEIANCPPILVLVARVQDAWLATWSRADAISAYPVDPVRLPQAVRSLLASHERGSHEDTVYVTPVTR